MKNKQINTNTKLMFTVSNVPDLDGYTQFLASWFPRIDFTNSPIVWLYHENKIKKMDTLAWLILKIPIVNSYLLPDAKIRQIQ